MSKAGMSHPPTKQDNSPYKKDNRGHNTPGDKRHSGNFVKNERPSPNVSNSRTNANNQSQNRDREFRERSDRNEARNESDNAHGDKDKDSSGEKKFTGRCRLFVGNLTPDVNEAEFRKMFETYGEISEVYVNTQRGFGFIRLDYRQNAEAAKAAFDGMVKKGRILRVRFATHAAALKVKNLHSHVSNELLEQSFVQFGELERCVVIVDDRGKSTGEGIVEFARKPGASSALRRITEGVFLMGADPKPVSVEPLEQKDEEDGMPEKFLTKTDQYKKEREKEPRFAPPGTFEYEFGMRWKQLDDLEKQRIEQVKKDTEKARIELEEEMQNALYDYQAEQIRQDLIRQQEELRRLEELRNNERMRLEMRRQKEEREIAEQEDRRRDMMMKMNASRQELARGRGGAGPGPMEGPGGMRSREEMMMAERFGERMGDRMGERMPDRMGDRMGGQGGPGFNMWKEEQQRNEAQMKGMRGGNEQPPNRGGRDMRGGPPGPQPPMQGGPPGPPSGPQGGMERGGPGGPNPGPGPSGPGPAGPGGQNKDGPKPLMQQGPGFNANSPGNNGPQNNPNNGPENNMDGCEEFSNTDACDDGCASKEKDLGDSAETDLATVDLENSPYATDSSGFEAIPKPPWTDEEEDAQTLHSDVSASERGASLPKEDIVDERVLEDMDVTSCAPGGKSDIYQNQYSVVDEKDVHCDFETDSTDYELNAQAGSFQQNRLQVDDCKIDKEYAQNNSTNDCDIDLICDKDSENNSSNSCHRQEESNNEDKIVYKDDTQMLESTDSSISPHELSAKVLDDHSSISSSPSSISTSTSSHTHHPSTSFTVTSTTSHIENVTNYQTASYSKETGLISSSSSHTNVCDTDTTSQEVFSESKSNCCANLTTNDNTVEYRTLSSISGDEENSNYNSSTNHSLHFENKFSNPHNCESSENYYYNSDYASSSYKQNLSGQSEDMDTEAVGNCDSETDLIRTTDSNVYQSYETSNYATIAGMDESVANVRCPESPAKLPNTEHSVTAIVPYIPPSEDQTPTHLPAHSTAEEKSSSSSDHHDEVFRTGDQTFKTEASRVAALASIASSSSASGSYAASAGLNPAAMLSASTMHIAQHQGGATIMQTQTMRAGPSGNMAAQATVLQKQALPNGGQAVVQQRTITNGGQTMMVQQRTMTNALGGTIQQTVVQQRVIPTNIAAHAQVAALRASALRQQQAHVLATQQAAAARASSLQQGIRVAQAVVGNSIYQAPALGRRTTMLHRAGGPSVLGPRLVQAPAAAQGSMMQRLVRQRYLGGPVLHPARGVQMLAGRPIRVKMAYTSEQAPTR